MHDRGGFVGLIYFSLTEDHICLEDHIMSRQHVSSETFIAADQVNLHDLYAERERYLETGEVPDSVRDVVRESWNRCREYCIDPRHLVRQTVDSRQFEQAQRKSRRLLEVAEPLTEMIHETVSPQPHLVVLADADGVILRLFAHAHCTQVGLEAANLFQGARWHERDIGCNGVGTSLAVESAVVLVGPEHFQDAYVDWTCIGVPLRDADGTIVGALDFSVPNDHVHLHTWGWILSIAQAIERQFQQAGGGQGVEVETDLHLATIENPFAAVRGVLELLPKQSGSDVLTTERLDQALREVDAAEQDLQSVIARLSGQQSVLAQSNRNKDAFLSTLAHELRNPLFVLHNALSVIEKKSSDPSVHRWAHGLLERQVGQLTRLVDDLSDMQLVERGKLRLNMESVNLQAAVQQAVEMVAASIEEKQQQLTVEVSPQLHLKADRTRLLQVITNLLTNATRYTPEHGSIAFEAVQSGDEIKISVRDTGKGISPELLPNIFGEFVQGDNRHPRGLGIGLNLVHKLVTAHGGSVAARSEGPGKGSEFTVRLPAGVTTDDGKTSRENATASSLRET